MTPRTKTEPVLAKPATSLERLHLWQIQAVRDVLWIGAVLVLVWVGYAMRAVTVPLLVALMLAYLFEPLVSRLSSHPRLTRPMVLSGLLLSLIVGVVIVLAIVVPLIVGQTVRLVHDLRSGRMQQAVLAARDYVPPEFIDDFDHAMQFFRGEVMPPEVAAVDDESIADDASAAEQPQVVSAPIEPISEADLRELVRAEVAAQLAAQASMDAEPGAGRLASLLQIGRRGADAVLSFLGDVLQIGFLLFLIPFYFFFFSLWYPHVVRFGRSMIPHKNRERTLELLGKMDRAVAGFVRGRIVISALMGVMFAIGWSICGVPYAVVLGLLIGVFSAVPYLGGMGIPLAVGLLLIDQLGEPADQRMSLLLIVGGPVAVFVIVQIVESYLLTPIIAGKATNLDPVTILVAVLAGGSVGGVYGMLLAIPAAACAKILITDVLLPRVNAWLRGESEDPLPISHQ